MTNVVPFRKIPWDELPDSQRAKILYFDQQGDRRVFAWYSNLRMIEFTTSGSIILRFGTEDLMTVTISGRRLESLRKALNKHSVSRIQCCYQDCNLSCPLAPRVDDIVIERGIYRPFQF